MDALTNLIWQLAAGGNIDAMTAKMNGLSADFRSHDSQRRFAGWLLIEAGQAGSLNKVAPELVYTTAVGFIEGYEYGTAVVGEQWAGPSGTAVSGTDISCDYVSGESPEWELFEWDFVTFAPAGVTPSDAGGTRTWSGLSAGTYVVARADESGLCSAYLQVV